MVENAVQHHPHPGFVDGAADGLEVIGVAQAGIYLIIVAGVIAVGVALKQRVEEHGVGAERPDMGHPVQHAAQPVGGLGVVLQRRAAQPQRVDLVHNGLVKPHKASFLAMAAALGGHGLGAGN